MKKTIKSLLSLAGYELTPYARSPGRMLHSFLSSEGVTQIIDVGANKGQFGRDVRRRGFNGQIISFEPLSEAYEVLMSEAAGDLNWRVMPRSAVGSETGVTEINISGNSVSSSILEMEQAHVENAPGSSFVGKESVALVTLDEIEKELPSAKGARLLKIDTQGFEMHVLDGAGHFLKSVHSVYLELSLAPLYRAQPSWIELSTRLLDAGFALWAVAPNFFDTDRGRVLQMDSLFVRTHDSSA